MLQIILLKKCHNQTWFQLYRHIKYVFIHVNNNSIIIYIAPKSSQDEMLLGALRKTASITPVNKNKTNYLKIHSV